MRSFRKTIPAPLHERLLHANSAVFQCHFSWASSWFRSAQRPRWAMPACFWHPNLPRSRHARSAEGMGYSVHRLVNHFSFSCLCKYAGESKTTAHMPPWAQTRSKVYTMPLCASQWNRWYQKEEMRRTIQSVILWILFLWMHTMQRQIRLLSTKYPRRNWMPGLLPDGGWNPTDIQMQSQWWLCQADLPHKERLEMVSESSQGAGNGGWGNGNGNGVFVTAFAIPYIYFPEK